MRKKHIYTVACLLLFMGGVILLESCQVNEEPSYERLLRQTKSSEEHEDEEESAGISFEMENEELEDEVEELLFVAKDWEEEDSDVEL